MKIAIVSDIHGNLTALDAVIADLELVGPDLIVHGGDLVFGGARPAEVLDRVHELGWPGVLGNTDEILWNFGAFSNVPIAARAAFGEQAGATRALVGEERLPWLQALPLEWKSNGTGLVHAVPGDLWPVILPDADDATLTATFGPLGTSVAVYCHIHRPYIRRLPDLIVANTGSVGLSLDGDTRASYLLLDDGEPETRRVTYDLERELALLAASDQPLARANVETLRRAAPPARR
jgi:putative phosphoesterase